MPGAVLFVAGVTFSPDTGMPFLAGLTTFVISMAIMGGVFAGALVLTLLSNFAQNLTDRYMTLTGLVFILVLLFAPAGLAGIGQQVKRFFDRRRGARQDDESQQDPPAAQPTESAITEGKQQ